MVQDDNPGSRIECGMTKKEIASSLRFLAMTIWIPAAKGQALRRNDIIVSQE
jgi:hypothetical protein